MIVYHGAGTHSADNEDLVIKDKQSQRGQIKEAVTRNYIIHDTCFSNSITINNNTNINWVDYLPSTKLMGL